MRLFIFNPHFFSHSVKRKKDSPIATVDMEDSAFVPYNKLLLFVPESQTEMLNFVTFQEAEAMKLEETVC